MTSNALKTALEEWEELLNEFSEVEASVNLNDMFSSRFNDLLKTLRKYMKTIVRKLRRLKSYRANVCPELLIKDTA